MPSIFQIKNTPVNTKILVVDDDQDYLTLIQDLLREGKRTKFYVDTVKTAQDALSKIKKERFDVILLDYRLPDMTGLDFMDKIQSLHFKIPIVLITSHGDRDLQEKAIEKGVADFLEKGRFTAELLEKTCLYAIGLNERVLKSEPAGVGLLVKELVRLTRESVVAQSQMAHEVKELRGDIRNQFHRLEKHTDKQKEDILSKFDNTWWNRGRSIINWGVEHPMASVFMLLIMISCSILLVLLLQVLDAENLRALKEFVN